jgi:hypothetical protein
MTGCVVAPVLLLFGVIQRAVVSFKAAPLAKGNIVWSEARPKVQVPEARSHFQIWLTCKSDSLPLPIVAVIGTIQLSFSIGHMAE